MPKLFRASTAASKAWLVPTLFLFNLLLYAMYFVRLDADFPNGSPWNDFAKYTDEGWYSAAAFHRWATGAWYVPGSFNPAVALPVWPTLLTGWFRLFGATMVADRSLAVLLFGASLILLFLLLRPWCGTLGSLCATTLVLVNPFCFAFDRLAILEVGVSFFLLLGMWVGTKKRASESQALMLLRAVAVGCILTLMVLTKTTAAVLAPALLYQLCAGSTGSNAWESARQNAPLSGCGRTALWKDRLFSFEDSGGRCLLFPLISAAVALVLWAGYFFLLVRPKFLRDYRHLFAINRSHAHGRILLQVMAQAVRHGLWTGPVVFSVALLLLFLSFRWARVLWRIPLWGSSVLAIAAYLGWIGWHTWFQPRYYLVCVLPTALAVALGMRALLERSGDAETGMGENPFQRIVTVGIFASLGIGSLAMFATTGRYVLQPTYSLRDASRSIAAIVRRDGGHSPLLLASSGENIALFTGLQTVNPEYPMDGLQPLLEHEHIGWYAAYSSWEDAKVVAMRRRYRLQEVARYRVFDEPQHRALILYRLDPLPNPL